MANEAAWRLARARLEVALYAMRGEPDVVLLETVGVGQDEIAWRERADRYHRRPCSGLGDGTSRAIKRYHGHRGCCRHSTSPTSRRWPAWNRRFGPCKSRRRLKSRVRTRSQGSVDGGQGGEDLLAALELLCRSRPRAEACRAETWCMMREMLAIASRPVATGPRAVAEPRKSRQAPSLEELVTAVRSSALDLIGM